MRPQTIRVSAAGPSAWIPMNRWQRVTNIGLAVVPSSGAVLTYTVEHTFDDPDYVQWASVTRSGTAATLKLVNHGLTVGDSIQVLNSGMTVPSATYAVATVVDADNVTYTVANTGATADQGNTQVVIYRVFPHAVLAAQTVRGNSNYAFPMQAVRLNLTAWTSGFADLTLLQAN